MILANLPRAVGAAVGTFIALLVLAIADWVIRAVIDSIKSRWRRLKATKAQARPRQRDLVAGQNWRDQ